MACFCNRSTGIVCGQHMATEGLIAICEAIFWTKPSVRQTRHRPSVNAALKRRADDNAGRLDYLARKLG